jgi:hypothetical protein
MLRQSVRGSAPAGPYTYRAIVGPGPGAVEAAAAFALTKAGANRVARSAAEDAGWEAEQVGCPPLAAGEAAVLPSSFALRETYPNPASGDVTVAFDLPEAGAVRLAVYDVLGREVAVLLNAELDAGQHEVIFDSRRLPSGSYLVRMEAGGSVQTRRVTFVR